MLKFSLTEVIKKLWNSVTGHFLTPQNPPPPPPTEMQPWHGAGIKMATRMLWFWGRSAAWPLLWVREMFVCAQALPVCWGEWRASKISASVHVYMCVSAPQLSAATWCMGLAATPTATWHKRNQLSHRTHPQNVLPGCRVLPFVFGV